jgi:regulator of RNase E activity RraA
MRGPYRPPIRQSARPQDIVPGRGQAKERPMAEGTSTFPDASLPAPAIAHALPIAGPPFARPDPTVIRGLYAVGSATASALMHRMGIRQTFIQGPLPRMPGAKIVGPVVTLQFMPQREDVVVGVAAGGDQEHIEKRTALWAVFDTVRPGDILAVQAFADDYTGCMGEMLITNFAGHGGIGIVVDGCIRDWPRVQKIGTPIWTRGFTPNFASQASLFPWAYNVPIACSRVLVLPGDIVIADDDGAVLVPAGMARMVLAQSTEHEDWEEFSRLRMAEGGSLQKYYPLDGEGRAEYEAWRKSQAGGER